MGDVVAFKKKSLWEKHKGSSLCRDGFHKWKVVTKQQFDVKQGKLVTKSACIRCGKEKTELL
jgi:formate dehydrogenase assembly factor FdhD